MPQCFCLKNKDAKVLQNTVHDVCRLLWKVFFKPIQRMEAHVQNIFDGILLDNIRRRTLWRIRRKTVYDFCCQVVCSCSLPRYGLVWPQSRVIIVGTHSAESVDQSVNLVTYVYDIIWVLYFAGCVRCIYNLLWYFNMRMFFSQADEKASCAMSCLQSVLGALAIKAHADKLIHGRVPCRSPSGTNFQIQVPKDLEFPNFMSYVYVLLSFSFRFFRLTLPNTLRIN